uniref:PHD-type domain-containing protein n=1 Tax=Aplanochytrium stocchinoi TaxID=215587 RepID=A0A7S3LLV4_9STRA
MYGAEIRQRKMRRLEMPRILDRYPENIRADFRNCSAKSLKSYISRYSLNAREDASVPEMASIVAKHFDQGMDAREEDIIPNFVNFILNYNGGNVESKGSKSRIERNRRGTRATAVVNNEMPSSEAEADDNSSGKKEDKKKDVENEVQEKEPKVYCFCQRKSFGDMIACDGAKCEIEWFHVGCVGINIDQLKGGKWYCSNCASKKKKELMSLSNANRETLKKA